MIVTVIVGEEIQYDNNLSDSGKRLESRRSSLEHSCCHI